LSDPHRVVRVPDRPLAGRDRPGDDSVPFTCSIFDESVQFLSSGMVANPGPVVRDISERAFDGRAGLRTYIAIRPESGNQRMGVCLPIYPFGRHLLSCGSITALLLPPFLMDS